MEFGCVDKGLLTEFSGIFLWKLINYVIKEKQTMYLKGLITLKKNHFYLEFIELYEVYVRRKLYKRWKLAGRHCE